MKSLEPQKIAGFVAIGFLVLAFVFFGINYFSPNLYYSLAISVPVFFAISFALVNYFINSFIYSKIKPIYQTIYGHDKGKAAEVASSDSDDILSTVNREVVNWMQDRTQEIQELKQMEKYRKEFLGNVSHELKTPIFNIQGYILTLLDGGIDDPNINLRYLTRTEKSIDRMISIIEDLEAISKLEAGELQLNLERFDLIQLVDDVFELQEIRANQKNIKLEYGEGAALPLWVKADKQRMFQVVSNLIVNSINYGKKGGETEISFFDMDNRVLVEVKDTGIGIAEESLPRVFERFYRADKSRSREQGGTGLGLAIVKHLIEAHGQRINVRSTLGKGTTFTFTLEKAI
ncbi:sensor histidine kinase [Carboxylicivirga sediminis]|uniref:histidine kinase n=1 Tax=Carboxylicivirga sediminis TaxID=2006564 RepID=A0A941FBG4_9BACT|nr:ATP-binding protein [Carboxylicivirga sediminis]MBR8538159.1 sensor histidine kinase [Carboxylicivirga sediminis]